MPIAITQQTCSHASVPRCRWQQSRIQKQHQQHQQQSSKQQTAKAKQQHQQKTQTSHQHGAPHASTASRHAAALHRLRPRRAPAHLYRWRFHRGRLRRRACTASWLGTDAAAVVRPGAVAGAQPRQRRPQYPQFHRRRAPGRHCQAAAAW
ncbi:hypothetical protein G8D20_07760 [Xanthomonas vesicatoria]|nr:hypothetical protein [Xanthomonas vesicatoria]